MRSVGIEPTSKASEASILSIRLRAQGANVTNILQIYYIATINITITPPQCQPRFFKLDNWRVTFNHPMSKAIKTSLTNFSWVLP